ncbi:MFS transporter [Nocardia bhagyanarayanae]|uniref:Putative MFS family arabinose efflux permease n=1 Tax=Nocardia bhagyanarayanae TaxID=1215925 RepID=A0A543FFD0_9NOCA|nr:MFS transporter [Nocardia bhagyanarayanae]TQM32575.1 putative MFS family arabinose efflux permease [Nocardia bhagyanarayanae]
MDTLPTDHQPVDPVATAPVGENGARQRGRVYFASAVGSAIEYYDFLIYATAASLVFGPVFFAGASPAVGVIASFGTLAIGYVARPLGGIVFGYFGDRVGRKSTLIWTLTLMGVATAAIGVVPTPDRIGVLAPCLLVAFRIVQGIAVGGEWAGAVLMSVEHARTESRGLFGSATQTGSAVGLLLSFAAYAALGGLSEEQFLSWGWRLPFLATIVLLGIGMYVRLSIVESPVMLAQQRSAAGKGGPAPLVALLRRRPLRVLLGIGVYAGPFMAYATATSFLVTYATTRYGVPRHLMLNALMIATAGMLVTIPLFAALSDRVGRRPVYITATLFTVVHAFTVVPLVTSGSFPLVLAAYVIGLTLLNAAVLGPVGALLAELFPTSSRYTGVSLAYQFSGVIGGGLGPLLAATFVAPGGPGILAVSAMIAAFCLVSAGCVWALGETRRADLYGVGD